MGRKAQKSGLTNKERKEILLILAAIIFVAVVGLVITYKTANVVGSAVMLDPSVPTYPGVISLLKDFCEPLTGSGDCNTICGTAKTCLPVDRNCDASATNNQCLCCSSP